MSLLRRLFILAFWLCIAIAYVAAIVPGRDAPTGLGWDKANHMLAFFTVTFLCRLAYPRLPVPLIALAMAAFGAAIELTQALPFIHRDAEWDDWFADCAAALAGLLIVWPVASWVDRRRVQLGLRAPRQK
ncbi:teicoplanin resistance protein VanZ [Sphingomonas sp. MMS24-J13]|uniref:teicoplanin resistance protein VanZ n=1 Tax=Sphingomonas sp. MMS24-J13 TaxID=3238686 RepID=UPI00384DAF56